MRTFRISSINMNAKDFFKPTKWKIITFILLFVVIYLIPWYKVEIDPNTVSMISSGRYPIIFGFIISWIIFPDMLSGDFILNEILVFVGFIFSFIVVYMLSCLIVYLVQKKSFAIFENSKVNKKF